MRRGELEEGGQKVQTCSYKTNKPWGWGAPLGSYSCHCWTVCRRVVRRLNPQGPSEKEKGGFPFLSFCFYCIYEKTDVSRTCGNHFTMYVNPPIWLYTLNLYSDGSQLFFSKTGREYRSSLQDVVWECRWNLLHRVRPFSALLPPTVPVVPHDHSAPAQSLLLAC